MDDVRAVWRRERNGRFVRVLEGGPMSMLYARRIRAGQGARPLRDVTPSGRIPNQTTLVRDLEAAQSYAEAVEREWGVEADMTRMAAEGGQSLARCGIGRARASPALRRPARLS